MSPEDLQLLRNANAALTETSKAMYAALADAGIAKADARELYAIAKAMRKVAEHAEGCEPNACTCGLGWALEHLAGFESRQ